MKLLSFNYQATRLLGVLISHITIHLSAFRLQQHGNREMNNEGEKYHQVVTWLLCWARDQVGLSCKPPFLQESVLDIPELVG